MNKTQAKAIAGSLSDPKKMPGWSYGLPAEECNVGAKLQSVPDSVCENCYALKGHYVLYAKTVKPAQYKRLASLVDVQWVNAMVVQISRSKNNEYFRWHDSGDLQDLAHLIKIVEVCKQTPETKHWLPTREYAIVKAYQRTHGEFPDNLVVRLSAHMKNAAPPSGYGLPTSTVVTDNSFTCPASLQKSECRECRACWNSEVGNVAYLDH